MNIDLKNCWTRLRNCRPVYNLVLIALILLALALVAHLLMQVATRHGARRTVPELAGIPLDEAERAARHNDLQLVVNDSLYVPAYEGGIVLDQLPEAGVEVKPGRKIYITINSFSQKMVDLPYVAGRSLRQAKNMLEIAGLEIDKLVYRPDMATNYVLEERYKGDPVYPHSRKKAEAGSGVTLYVGVEGGYGTTVVPQVVGSTLRGAKSRLWENGLNVGRILFDKGINLLNQKDARVYRQEPSPGRSHTLGTPVDVWLTLDDKVVSEQRTAAEKIATKAAAERQRQESVLRDSLDRAAVQHVMEGGEQAEDAGDDGSEFFD